MKVRLYTNNINEYLLSDNIIDFENENIKTIADELYKESEDKLSFIKLAYEFVRDKISHSADINNDEITCTASEVLDKKHGISFAKAHLLAALLRCKSIPVGFCYQKLTFNINGTTSLVYHGLNGVYISEYKKWIRLDARGNKEGINAQFSLDTERLAYSINIELGEEDGFIVYPEPDKRIIHNLKTNKTRTQLWNNLPTELEYNFYMK